MSTRGSEAAEVLERSVVQEIYHIVAMTEVSAKLRAAGRLCRDWIRAGGEAPESMGEAALTAGPGDLGTGPRSPGPPGRPRLPGRPADWRVVAPHEMSDRPRLGSPEGRYQLLHAVAHIELSAVELALLAAADFPGQPRAYYRDMLGVAFEEVVHVRLAQRRLHQLGGELGSEPVHLALWETTVAHDDLVERLAVVPRILEARGLDVSGRLREQLHRAGDSASANLLERIYRDEIGHVAVGTAWYRRVCAERGLDAESQFIELFERFRPRRGSLQIDEAGRRAAGFTERELRALGC